MGLQDGDVQLIDAQQEEQHDRQQDIRHYKKGQASRVPAPL
jgi:hypothetical protein